MGRLANTWHLRLFKDSTFVNIVVGLAAFNVSNINFSMVLPFLLMDRGLTRADAALCMSVTAAADIVARLLVPCIRLKHMGARNTLMVAMVALAFIRSRKSKMFSKNFVYFFRFTFSIYAAKNSFYFNRKYKKLYDMT
jgi:hypothetical protein